MSEVLAKCAIAAQNIQFTKLAKFEFAHLCWSPVWRQSKVQDSHQRTPTSRIMIGLLALLFFLPSVYTSFLASDLLSTVRVWEKFTMNKFRNRWSLTLGIRLRLTKLSPPTSIFSPSTGHHPGTSGTLLYRIVGKGPVVFMQHGMVGSSTAWYITTWTWLVIENQAPCWTRPWSSSLPTCGRGLRCLVGQLPRKPWEQVDKYSDLYSSCREHQIFDPDTEDEFWQFSQDEMSKYDLPSQLNYVLQFTNKKKERVCMWSCRHIWNPHLQIFYVGHSMGTTTYMAMNSMDPTWSEKVELAVFLAPVAYVGHMRSPVRVDLSHGVSFLVSP